MSLGLIELRSWSRVDTPSITYKGPLSLMELIPRMRTIVAEPGAPEVPMFTPAALPCNCCVAEEPEDANSSSVSITATEPVMSFFCWVP